MSVITEAALRVLLKDADLAALQEYRVDSGVIVTPSARAWLIDHKIDLVIGDKRVIKNPGSPGDKAKSVSTPRKTVAGEKPEHMTALYGSNLVPKDHLRIIFRGKLDSLESKIIEVQLALLGMEQAVADLSEVLAFVREVLRGEVTGNPLPPMVLLGKGEAEIRSHSHNPKKYYGIPHFAPGVDDGAAVVFLNRLRSDVREAEIAAYQAFKTADGQPEREDICRAMNRLSSVFYVMMLKAKAGEYSS